MTSYYEMVGNAKIVGAIEILQEGSVLILGYDIKRTRGQKISSILLTIGAFSDHAFPKICKSLDSVKSFRVRRVGDVDEAYALNFIASLNKEDLLTILADELSKEMSVDDR